jgi:hypothetical protein
MTATPKALSRSVLTGSSATLYTVPALTTTIVTNIVLANTSASAVPVTLALDGVALVPAVSVAANSTTVIDVRQPLATTKLITGFAGTASVIACHIAGSEVS